MLQKLGSSINHNQLTRVPLTTFTSINTKHTVDHCKKNPIFPLYYINGNVKNTLLTFAPCTIRFIISFLMGGGKESKFILKNGNGERENDKWEQNREWW